jgi:N-acylneuraminate cytidylyltransferase
MGKSIAIITARGGSKRIPKKNIKDFLGVPIIKYSIDAAINSKCFDVVMVSTDDKEIADIAVKFGANVPFYRSLENSNDFSGTAEVLEEVIKEYKKLNIEFEFLCCIYPTAPFTSALKISKAMKMLIESEADCVLPITRFSYPIQRALKIENNLVHMIWPENYQSRSQDLMPAYHDCGQFYCLRTKSLLEQKRLFANYTIPIEIPESEVQDIDNEEDWKIAEMKYRIMVKNNS